jgi:hypothetical protein
MWLAARQNKKTKLPAYIYSCTAVWSGNKLPTVHCAADNHFAHTTVGATISAAVGERHNMPQMAMDVISCIVTVVAVLYVARTHGLAMQCLSLALCSDKH